MDLERQLAEADRLRHDVKVDEAIGIYRLLLLNHPDSVRARHGLGLCVGFKGRLDEAVSELESAAALAPLSTIILLDLAKTYMMAEMYIEGETAFKRVLKLDPDNHEAKTQLQYCQMAGMML
ncbi:MAG: tetratricopeptide repeat protein [Armatimonadota bacterium]